MADRLVQPLSGAIQLGPPRLFEDDGLASSAPSSWLWFVGAVAVALCGAIALRRLWRMRLTDERLAFLLMSRRLGLGRGQRDSIERLARRSGTDPIGLVMCESAFALAAAGGRFGDPTAIERKPVLLTGAELSELGSACEKLFGAGAIDRLQRDAETDANEGEPSDAQRQRGQWVA
ncbi:MAG: hypothetical protein NXI14_11620 [bacterium]|nr:hypothetical protein [bacterium]